ncbi:MAG: hypothetical protein WCD37_08505 [Chloroflexia bacterium]
MTQMNLPLYTPQDRGRLNALQNILLAVSDELRQQAPVIGGIVDFTVNQFPSIVRDYTPFDLVPANPPLQSSVSPYPFEVLDLVRGTNRPQVFSSVGDLVQSLDLDTLSTPLQDVELIGIDESQVDSAMPQSRLAFLRSIAFRMYRLPDGTPDEAVGPILSELRMQVREDESFDSENKLLSYIRNNYIAYISALTSLAFGRRPFIVLHGPLVRAIGGFSSITFSQRVVEGLLSVNADDAGQFDLPQATTGPVLAGDAHTRYNLPLDPLQAVSGAENLRRFNEFCRRNCNQCSPTGGGGGGRTQDQQYSGFCLYLWVLRSLVDLCRIVGTTVVSVVEDVSRATEMTRFVLPSLLMKPEARQAIERSSLGPALKAVGIKYSSEEYRGELFRQAKETAERLNLSDSSIFSYVLAEGQYTAPVQIYRYRARSTFVRTLNDAEWGIDNRLDPILDAVFPSEGTANHPGYRVLMSYVRTTPLREPIRVEYFDLPHLRPAERVIGPVYLMSLPYQDYGLPVILYYTDKLARTPTQLVRAIVEREYLDLVLQSRFSDPVSIMQVLGRLTRNYFERG